MVKSQKKVILCVDDERLNRELLKALLIPRGFEVAEAADGTEALSLLDRTDVDVILLDIMMPRMDGFEVCRRIKADDQHRNIPVIMLTALTSKEDRIRGIEAGAEEFITKPFDQTEVLARLRMLLKVKELNDRLFNAYNTIRSLTSFGEAMIHIFRPADFDLMVSVEGIIGQILTPQQGGRHRPATILFGLSKPDGTSRLLRYETIQEKLVRSPLDFPWHSFVPRLEGGQSSAVAFRNREALEASEFSELVRKLDTVGIEAFNLVAYTSANLCLFAINYPAEPADYDAVVLESLVVQTLFLKSLAEQITETEGAFGYTVHALARASEANDEDTGNHILRVGEYCAMVAEALGLSDKFIRAVRIQATLHDIGKIHTPPQILKKPGKLDEEEWEEMKRHTLYGAKIIGDHARLAMARSIAFCHHERWDGSGYPQGLKGDRIPAEGRIIALADTYDALRNRRVYKPPVDHATTVRIICEGDSRSSPAHYDPDILSAFRRLSGRFEEIYEKIGG